MSLSDEQWLFTQSVAELIQYAKINGIKLTMGECQRFPDRQEKLVSEGKSWTLKSKHLNKFAIDFNVFIKVPNSLIGTGFKWQLTWKYEDIESLGIFWESLSEKNLWGGHFKDSLGKPKYDCPHFQRSSVKRKD